MAQMNLGIHHVHHLLIAFCAMALVLLPQYEASAQCVELTQSERFRMSDAVFTGRAFASVPNGVQGVHVITARTTFAVERVWKGPELQEIEVGTDETLEVGQDYLVFAGGQRLSSSFGCGGIERTNKAETTLMWLASRPSKVLKLFVPDAYALANAETRRLSPSTFAELSPEIQTELHRRGCLIPQTYADRQPHNVVRARLRSEASLDVAVLCSRERTSGIIVFWDGQPQDAIEIARRPDAEFLQVVTPGQIGFSRAIGVASPQFIRKRNVVGFVLPLSHQGLHDMFIEKASVVWYWHNGAWLQLRGAD